MLALQRELSSEVLFHVCRNYQKLLFHADFNSMVPVIEEADVVVFATPLYWYTFPAQLKAVIDKFFALYNRSLANLCTQFKVAYTCDETKAKSEPLSSISISFC